jgi:glyoxylate reductase
MATVAVTRRLPMPAIDRLQLDHSVRLHEGDLPPTRSELFDMLVGADAVISLLTDRIDDEAMAAATRLRVVANYAVGYDNIDLTAARARGIAVGNTPDVLTAATADMAMALMLATSRRLPEAQRYVIDGMWRTWEPLGHLGLELDGAHLVIVGAGRIGRAVARRAKGFGIRVEGIDRAPRSDLLRTLANADIVSLHCPLTDETLHVIDAEALACMKPTSILINTARGPLVDHIALAMALDEGELAAAGLDVTDPEPLEPQHPLLRHPGVIITPHIASATQITRLKMANMAVDNVLAGLHGQPLPYGVV